MEEKHLTAVPDDVLCQHTRPSSKDGFEWACTKKAHGSNEHHMIRVRVKS